MLILPATAGADCVSVISKAAFKGSVAQWYPQQCYSTAVKKLGPDVYTYSPNVPANLKSAIVRPSDFDHAFEELQLSPEGDRLWQAEWRKFTSGA